MIRNELERMNLTKWKAEAIYYKIMYRTMTILFILAVIGMGALAWVRW